MCKLSDYPVTIPLPLYNTCYPTSGNPHSYPKKQKSPIRIQRHIIYMELFEYKRLKEEIRQKAKQYLSGLGYNPDLVDTMDCYADRHEGFLAVYPDIEPKGLTNDMETLPIPLIYYYADDDRFEITDAGIEYLKRDR